MKDSLTTLNQLWNKMLCIAIATLALVVITLICKEDWSTALLASTIFGMLYLLHKNRKILLAKIPIVKGESLSAEAEGLMTKEIVLSIHAKYLREVETNHWLRRTLDNKDLFIRTLAKDIYKRSPDQGRDFSIELASLVTLAPPDHKRKDAGEIIQAAANCKTYDDTAALIKELRKFTNE